MFFFEVLLLQYIQNACRLLLLPNAVLKFDFNPSAKKIVQPPQ